VDLRRLGIALVVLAAGLGLLAYYAGQRSRQEQPAAPPAASAPASAPAAAPAEPAPAADRTSREESPAPVAASEQAERAEKWFGTVAEQHACTIGALDDPNAFLLQVQLFSRGAAVYTAKLADYFVTVADKHLFEKDPRGYDSARAADSEKYQGHYSVLNPVGPQDRQTLSLATVKLTVEIEAQPDAAITLDGFDTKCWELQQQTPESATFAYYLYRGENWDEAKHHPVLKLTKTYSLRQGDYTVYVSLKLANLSSVPLKVSLDQAGPTGLPEEAVRGEKRQVMYGQYVSEDQKVRVRFKTPKDLRALAPGKEIVLGSTRGGQDSPPVLWVGASNKYFASMMYPLPAQADKLAADQLPGKFYVEAVEESGGSKTYATGVRLTGLDIAAGGTLGDVNFEVFVGPKKRDLFSDSGAPHYREIYHKLGFLGTIEFGACCTWAPLSLGMMWLLQSFSTVTFGNYGLAIIVLVFLVRLVLHPLTKKGQVAMMKMQKLAPQAQKLKEKYGDDKEALNREMMQFYRQQGPGQLLGCLPMILQMPIWVALFTALSASIELRHAGFLPFWITDLSAPDAIWSWSAAHSLPLVGHTLNLLPLLLTVAMFLQAKMTPTMAQVAATPEQQRQQKMMQYLMPIMMLFVFYPMPSGLTLYIMASTFAGVLEQKVIRDHMKAREAAAAAAETTVKLPGKSFRGQRPKKPRGPFWVKRG